jgi:tetratricopeptide (TPR) repeat protein
MRRVLEKSIVTPRYTFYSSGGSGIRVPNSTVYGQSDSHRSLLLVVTIAVIAFAANIPPPIAAQQPGTSAPVAPNAKSKPDYSQEPFVVESLVTRARFENDGTGRVETTASVRVQNDAGVRALDELVFPYNGAAERMDIPYVRVRRADGSTIVAPPAGIQDLAAQAVRNAPLYADAREKHISVPPLHPGEALEYQVLEVIQHPLIPGQFWFEQNFEKNAIVLDQKFELDVPAGRALKLETRPGLDPHTEESSGRRIYSWTSSHTARTNDSAGANPQAKSEDVPEVRVSTFSSWEELGAWFQSVLKAGAAVTPEIQKKADELTQSGKTPAEKLGALYDYVAVNFRYVNLPFGSGHFAPHPLAAVLKNGYADSIDKHALLTALAAAAGLRADAVLISGPRNPDPEMPSPADFDRVITRVTAGTDVFWLDTTTEVAPFGFLISTLRHRQALDVPLEGPATILETPADPPFPVHQIWRLEGSLSGLGKLDAHVHYVLRGDNELLLRSAFHRTPQSKWKELGQAIAASDGLRGEVDEVKPADPADTHHPFTLDYHVVEPGFFDWSSRRTQLALPLPPLALPDPSRHGEAIVLGSPAEVTIEMKLALPLRYTARAPVATSVSRDYGEYRSAYSAAHGVLTASRTLGIRQHEIPATSAGDYTLLFRRAVRTDEDQTFALESAEEGAAAIPDSAPVDDLVQAATSAYAGQKFALAEQLLERAVARAPAHKRAWKLLGAVRLAQQENEKAVEAFRKQIEIEPADEFAYEGLGLAEAALQHYDEAIAAFRKQLEVKPFDRMAQASLGATLGEAHRWAEAEKELEKAVALSTDDPRLYLNLGRAELNLDHADKAQAAFDKAVELSPSPPVWNRAAYELVQRGVNLDRAQKFAELAVAGTESELSNVTLDVLTGRDLAHVASLATYWDTLGWACFARGDRKRAERFVEAAWRLDLRGEAGDHLGQIYEEQGHIGEAARMYALALATAHPPPDTRARLEKLAGATKPADALVARARDDLPILREYNLPRLLPAGTIGAAEFFVLLGPEAHPEAVKFVRGDAKLRGAAEKIRALNFGSMLPDETPAKLVRLGRLGCGAERPVCTFTLFPADQVRAVE